MGPQGGGIGPEASVGSAESCLLLQGPLLSARCLAFRSVPHLHVIFDEAPPLSGWFLLGNKENQA